MGDVFECMGIVRRVGTCEGSFGEEEYDDDEEAADEPGANPVYAPPGIRNCDQARNDNPQADSRAEGRVIDPTPLASSYIASSIEVAHAIP